MVNLYFTSDGINYQQRRQLFLWLVVLTLVLSVLPTVATAAPKSGGTLTFGTENDFAGFEALKSSSRLAINGSIAANTIMEPLFRMDAEDNLIPVLGLSAEPSDDGKTWTVKLRPGVTFHDGTPFNADAVVHHWGRIFDPKNKFRGRNALSAVISVEKAGAHSVYFRLKHPWLPFLGAISSPRTLFNLIPSPTAVDKGIQNRAPVGTGPFVFKEWVSGDRFAVTKNEAYWDSGKPYLDQIVFKPMPDQQTRFASLLSGQLDMIWMDRGNIITKAANDQALRVYQSDDNGAEIFILNLSVPPLDNETVRHALAYASKQESYVKVAYQDSIPVVHHPFGKDFDCPDDGYRAYDADKARELLAAYAAPVELEVLHSNSKRGRDIGEILQRLLKDAGATIHPMGLEFGPVIKKVISAKYQVSTWRMSSRPDQGPPLFRAFHSKSRGNFSHYQNPEMDRLLEAQRMETDPQKRKALLCSISRLINRDVPILYRGGMRNHVIAYENVRGISDMAHGIIQLRGVWVDR